MRISRGRALLWALTMTCSLLLAHSAPLLAGPGPRRSPERWKKQLSRPKYDDFVSSTHYIEAEDGTQLSLTVFLPEGLPERERVPTLLEISPYQPLDRGLSAGGLAPGWRDFVLRGAAYVEADARGTMGSEGCLDFGGSADRSDARVFAEWIRSQGWSNGVIVTDGVSHPGMGSVVAHTSIPGITASLAHAPVVSYYQDEWLQGAKFEDQFNGPLYEAIEMLPSTYPDPQAVTAQASTCRGRTTLDYSSYDGPFTDLWADRDLSRFVPRREAPVLLTHGFVDLNVHPDHSQLYWDALPDDYPKFAIFGWWYHGHPDMRDHAAQQFEFVRHRWLDATLFGLENGLWNEPRVLVEDSKGTWHEGHDWPLEPSRPVTFYPDEGGGLASAVPRPGRASYTDRIGAERGTWTDASVVFRTKPLSAAKLINGQPRVHLTASSTETQTKWVAYLIDEARDGTWERISHGYADSHSYGRPESWLEMEPGKEYRWTLDLQPTAVVVDKGHRIVLVIASQDSRRHGDYCFSDYRGGCYNPSGILPSPTVGRAVNTVIVGPEATSVELDWVDPGATRKPPW